MRRTIGVVLAVVVMSAVVLAGSAGAAGDRRQAGPKSVTAAVKAHIAAVIKCDVDALVAGYRRDATLFYPDGVVIQGRTALRKALSVFSKPYSQGGLCGLRIKATRTWRRGGAIFIRFRVTAPFIAKTYYSTDGYYIRHGLIYAEVSTYDQSKIKFKK
jgi:hypothetical protein